MPVERMRRAWRNHNLIELLSLLAKNACHLVQVLLRRVLVRGDTADRRFDQIYGTDTTDIREVGSLDIPRENVRHAVRYQPTAPELFREMISAIDDDLSRFTFIDFGSGKGRTLILASNYQFSRIIGVEFSAELDRISKQNMQLYQNATNAPCRIEPVCCDATDYRIPAEPLVCYMYNPFGQAILSRVMTRIEHSLSEHPRKVYLVYLDAVHRSILDASQSFRPITTNPRYSIYCSK
jgi:predicted RNA methylase